MVNTYDVIICILLGALIFLISVTLANKTFDE